MAKQQINIRVEDKLAAEVDKAKDEAGYNSRNEVAAEVLELYLPLWLELKRRQREVLEEQQQRLFGTLESASRRRKAG
jgi:metal-responsive CopG/Arc/MetJ family transcriptional regulator